MRRAGLLGRGMGRRLAHLAMSPLAVPGALWWWTRERRLGRGARPLDPAERAALEAWFDSTTLDAVRIARVEALADPTPIRWLRRVAEWLRIESPASGLRFAHAAGVTFGEVIAICDAGRGTCPLPLLFHELVHVVQVRHLGRRRFLVRYARGWLAAGCRYRAIPLEEQAFRLERRYRQGEEAVSVEAVVAKELAVAPLAL